MTQQRLVVVVKGYPRLSETFIAQELRGLELAGYKLTIVSLRHPTDRKRHAVHDEMQADLLYLPEYLHHEPLRVLRGLVATARRARFWRLLPAVVRDFLRDPSRNRLRRLGQAAVLVREWPSKNALLHAHFIHTPASVTDYAARIMGMDWSVSAHAKDIWTQAAWDLRGKLARARWAVTCTASGFAHLQGLAREPARVHLSYHGLNLNRFPPFEARRELRDGQDRADPVRLVSVGRAVPKKGYDVLLRGLAQLPGDLYWTFDHMGGGGDLQMLQALAKDLGIADRCRWRGAVDQSEVLAAYRAADVFVLASRITADGDRDGLPNVLVEAASQTLACVASDLSGIPELISDPSLGWLVPSEDPAALALTLQEAITRPDLRAAKGAAVAAKVRQHFDYRNSVAQLTCLFESGGARP
ncbi:Glycosyltransferase involved in cell wall bisynthesis [Loktanella atrilutea]|uniref:Glycosyltransferase involved in cell wall bisynthesis n=1 Tax=Loktanella atrilutea TaxID=366533 RepID=A0A1M4YT37_LOKAT|nr:glycosyltransferase family 4 protein [Loktanella atrilutea]SHF08984.1 Glycosyltransferase involved in cell wall bisynthesis [Loktanella atrilutea]